LRQMSWCTLCLSRYSYRRFPIENAILILADESSGKLHFQSDAIALRMSALADCPCIFLWVGTCFAAMNLAVYCLATTARMCALVYLCHERSSEPDSAFPGVGDVVGRIPLLSNCTALLLRLIRHGQSGFLGLIAWKHTLPIRSRVYPCVLCGLLSESIIQSTNLSSGRNGYAEIVDLRALSSLLVNLDGAQRMVSIDRTGGCIITDSS
jgi:hypothetical protein